MPGAGRRRRNDRNAEAASADALVGSGDAPVFHAVRPLDYKREGNAEGGDARRIAQQRGDVDALAGAIDAALGIDEGIEARRALAAGHPAIREIESRALRSEERR